MEICNTIDVVAIIIMHQNHRIHHHIRHPYLLMSHNARLDASGFQIHHMQAAIISECVSVSV